MIKTHKKNVLYSTDFKPKKKKLWKACKTRKLRRETWIRNIGCESSAIPAKIYICEKHFFHGNNFEGIKHNNIKKY